MSHSFSFFPFSLERDRALVSLSLTLGACAMLTGCGGQDFGGLQRNLNGDIGTGYNTSLAATNGAGSQDSAVGRGSYAMIETSFRLPSVPGDPFDYEKVDVQVTLRKPGGGTVDVPAFYDGDRTWRARYTPIASGTYAVATVRLNKEIAHEENLTPKDWNVKGEPEPGFVRIDRGDHMRFLFDNGARYYPIGHNQAWSSQNIPSTPDLFAKMHAVGENWSRVWMTAWDGKNLDWPSSGKAAPTGALDLAAAKKWDQVVQGAEKNGIYFQMVLQHHGQYSTTVDPNWNDNPYSVKNGGFLTSPTAFFNDPRARALTRRKLRYILARWGYSPNIMAFELFNEVEGTDAAHANRFDDIALWHREMSLFLKQYDLNRHLITTSALPADNPVWDTVDYLQVHAYPPDVITALGEADLSGARKLNKPVFVGEFGASGLQDPEGTALHAGLWAGMMRWPSGAPEYWDWENVQKHDLYHEFLSPSLFVAASGLSEHGGLTSLDLTVQTDQRADLRFGPGGGFTKSVQNEFVVGSGGAPPGFDKYPSYLQGTNHRDMMPRPLTLQVNYPQAGTFVVTIDQVATAGGHLRVGVDGKTIERDFLAGTKEQAPAADQSVLQIDVPQGLHTLTIENSGKDWVHVSRLTLGHYGTAMGAIGRAGRDFLAAWVYHRANIDAPLAQEAELKPAAGTLELPPLQAGRYRATWWDTNKGAPVDETDLRITSERSTRAGETRVATEQEHGTKGSSGPSAAAAQNLIVPPFKRDIALYVVKLGSRPASGKNKKVNLGKQQTTFPSRNAL